MDSLTKWLTDELIRVGTINADTENPVTRDEALTNVAEVIAAAIEKGTTIVIKGSATVAELNAMDPDDKEEGDIWSVTDSGFLRNDDAEWLEVIAGDIVRYNGSAWEMFLHLDLANFVQRPELEKHTGNTQNPHRVTAEQVGTYPKSEIDAKIDAVAKNHLDMRVTSDVVEFFTIAT